MNIGLPCRKSVVALMALVATAACVDGRDPVGLDLASSVSFAVAPSFAVKPAQSELAHLGRVRIRALDQASGQLLGFLEEAIDPEAERWSFDLTIDVPAIRTYQVVVTVELLSDVVEWSGRAPPLPVTNGADPSELRLLDLFRGPLENLGITDLELTEAPDTLSEGVRGRLGSAVVGGEAGSRVFFRSLSPDVMEVDRDGAFRGLGPGVARVEARAGRLSDTVDIVVLPRPLEPGAIQAIERGLDDILNRLAPGLQDGPGAAAIVASLADLDVAVASRRPAAVQDALAAAWSALNSYGSPQLRYEDGPGLSLIGLVLDCAERMAPSASPAAK